MYLGDATLRAFHDELKKYAAPMPPAIHAMLGAGGAGAGVGAAAGGLIGAGVQGVKTYREARESGVGRGRAALQGALGGLSGAGRGATMGAVAGGLGGGLTGALSPGKGEAFRKALTNIPGSHFGQRQVHGLTSWTPAEGVGSIGLGAAPKQSAVDAAKDALQKARGGEGSVGFVDKLRGRSAEDVAHSELVRARAARLASHQAEKMGLTNIPGYLESMHEQGVGKTLGTAFREQWHSQGPGMKALMVGMPAAELAHETLSEDAPNEQGTTKQQRVGRALAHTAGGLLLSPMAQGTQMIAGAGLGHLGHAGGTMVDRLRQKPQGVVSGHVAHDLTADSGQSVPGERVISDRAAGGSEGVPA